MNTFENGAIVRKDKGDYQGDGIVITSFGIGKFERVIVGMCVEGGEGLFYHVFAPHQLVPIKATTLYHKVLRLLMIEVTETGEKFAEGGWVRNPVIPPAPIPNSVEVHISNPPSVDNHLAKIMEAHIKPLPTDRLKAMDLLIADSFKKLQETYQFLKAGKTLSGAHLEGLNAEIAELVKRRFDV